MHTFIQSHSSVAIRWGLSPFLHRLFAQWGNLPVVPSRESNSGLPYSKPTSYQLSHAAPKLSHAAPKLSHAAPKRRTFTFTFTNKFSKSQIRKFAGINNLSDLRICDSEMSPRICGFLICGLLKKVCLPTSECLCTLNDEHVGKNCLA